MYTIKCAICDVILGESSIDDKTLICDNHPQDVVNEFVCPTTWDTIRAKRDELLLESDWTQLVDSPLTQAEKDSWATYRQYLRDIPELFEDPKLVVFPSIGEFLDL